VIIDKKLNRNPVEIYNILSSKKNNFIRGSDSIYIN